MEVLDKEDEPIPGIYAAGIDTGGWVGEIYYIKTPGTTFAFAISSGRLTAESAVEASVAHTIRKRRYKMTRSILTNSGYSRMLVSTIKVSEKLLF